MTPLVPPRRQAWLLAATLVTAALRVATYDAPPGVRSRDMATVVDATRARSSAHVVVHGDIVVEGYGFRMYAEGDVSFADGRAAMTVALPGIVSVQGPPPEYDVRLSDRSAYVRSPGGSTWYAFPSHGVGTFVPDPFLLLDMASKVPAVRRVGGESVRGAGCDHYRGEAPPALVRPPAHFAARGTPLRVDAWVAADGVPRRVAVSVRSAAGELWRITLDLFRYDTPVSVEVPEAAVDVRDATAAFDAMGDAA